ncbi:MAG: TraB/GumN family protein, partial [Bacteroidales bacterium]|nr:TraB/GumN family protein [Bacteroidales bacterium]
MRRIIFTIAALAGLLLQGNSQSLLWKIYGKGLRDTSYLYGTIHIQDKRVFHFDSIVYDKFNAVEAYAMELNPEKIDMAILKKEILMKKHTLKELLPDSDYQYLNDYMQKKMGTGVLLYNKMKPFFLESQLSQMDMPKDEKKALDLYFFDYAKKHQKITLGIEKLEDQLGAIKAISLPDQAKMLMQTVRDTTQTDFEDLLDAYLHADFDKFAE